MEGCPPIELPFFSFKELMDQFLTRRLVSLACLNTTYLLHIPFHTLVLLPSIYVIFSYLILVTCFTFC